jgi:hypothetical protein
MNHVTFEQAVKLKQKGFQELVNYFYTKDGKFYPNSKESGDEPMEFEPDDFYDNFNYKNLTMQVNGEGKYLQVYSAPEIHQVIDWLFTSHNIHIEICLSDSSPYSTFYYRVLKVGQYFTLSHDGIYSDTPAKAYSSAIDYVLNNLI